MYGLCKIDTTQVDTGGDVTVQEIARDGFYNSDGDYVVSGDGSFFIYRAEDGMMRLRPVGASGYAVLPFEVPTSSGAIPVLRGLDSEVYTVAEGTLKRLDLGVDSQTGGPALEVEDVGPWEGEWTGGWTESDGGRTWVVGGKLLVQREYFVGNAYVELPGLEIDIDARRGRDRSAEILDGFTSLLSLGYSYFEANGQYVFIFGTRDDGSRAVRRWAPATGEVVTFDQLGDLYDIETFKILGGGDAVWFEATRRADDATIIGELAVDGSVTELETITAAVRTIDVLTPINPADFITVDGKTGDWGDHLIQLSGSTGAAGVARVGIVGDGGKVKLLVDLNEGLDSGLEVLFDTQPDVAGQGEYRLRYDRTNDVFELLMPSGETRSLEGSDWLVAEGASAVEIAAVLEDLGTPATLQLVVSLGSYTLNGGIVTDFAAEQSTHAVSFAAQ